MSVCTRREQERHDWAVRRAATAAASSSLPPIVCPPLVPQLKIYHHTPDGTELARATIKEQVVQVIIKQVQETGGKTALAPVYKVGSWYSYDDTKLGSSVPDRLHQLAFLHEAERPGGVTAMRDALPAGLARATHASLASAPESAWNVLSNDGDHLEALRKNHERQRVCKTKNALQKMRYSTLKETFVGLDREAVAAAVGEALRVEAHEQIIMNFARYRAGDFLDSHTDSPSGNAAYERRRAWVWHLSEGWSAAKGGAFVDEEADVSYVPTFNTLVHFPVPRYHRVEPVASGVDSARYTAYGWIITPEVHPLGDSAALARLQRECGGTAVVGWFGREPASRPLARRQIVDLATACLGRLGIERMRGEDARFAVATDEEVARELGLCTGNELEREGGGGGTSAVDEARVGVVRWAATRVDVVRLSELHGGAAALGVFVDRHREHQGGPGDREYDVELAVERAVDGELERRANLPPHLRQALAR
jgi:Rps23 Pro-64 3,4-dihydroxylase Tpa1-like proline 4-hydroxylase